MGELVIMIRKLILVCWLFCVASVFCDAPVFAAITFVNTGVVNNDQAVDSIEIAAAASIQDDDLLVIGVIQAKTAAAETIVLDETGWVEVLQVSAPSSRQCAVFYKKASSESGTYTAKVGVGVNSDWRGVMTAYRGVDTTTPSDQTATKVDDTIDNDIHDPAAITTQTNNAWVIVTACATQSAADAGTTQSSGYTMRSDTGRPSGVNLQDWLGVATKEVATAASEDPGNWSGLDQGLGDPDSSSITWAIRPASTEDDSAIMRKHRDN